MPAVRRIGTATVALATLSCRSLPPAPTDRWRPPRPPRRSVARGPGEPSHRPSRLGGPPARWLYYWAEPDRLLRLTQAAR